MKKWILGIITVWICTAPALGEPPANPNVPETPPVTVPENLTKARLIQLAAAKATVLAYSPEKMHILFDRDNAQLKKYFLNQTPETENDGVMVSKDNSDQPMTPEKAHPVLKDRDYQAVYFSSLDPKETEKDLWVLLDRKTGEVLTVIEVERPAVKQDSKKIVITRKKITESDQTGGVTKQS